MIEVRGSMPDVRPKRTSEQGPVTSLYKSDAREPYPFGLRASDLGLRNHGAPGEIRTPDLLIRSQTLYPAEPRAHVWLGWLDSNQRMPESKSGALPLGDTPKFGCGGRI